MRWMAAIMVLAMFAGLALQQRCQPGAQPEPVRSSRHATPGQLYEARELINALGYDCRAVDEMLPFAFSEGWTVWCNGMRYRFELANHGGKWSVEAK